MPRASEELPARLGVACHDVLYLVAEPVGSFFHAPMQKLSQIVNLGWREAGETRHSFLRTALQNHRANRLALFIVQHNRRAYQVRTLGSGCIRAMAKGAILGEQGLPTCRRRCIRWRTKPQKLPSSFESRIWRALLGCLCRQNGWYQKQREHAANAGPCRMFLYSHLIYMKSQTDQSPGYKAPNTRAPRCAHRILYWN